jgi:hypothetical protein
MNDKPSTDHPVLLLPVRLEARSLKKDESWNLWMRIYQDRVFVDTSQASAS